MVIAAAAALPVAGATTPTTAAGEHRRAHSIPPSASHDAATDNASLELAEARPSMRASLDESVLSATTARAIDSVPVAVAGDPVSILGRKLTPTGWTSALATALLVGFFFSRRIG